MTNDHDHLTNGDMSLMLFKWTTELAFIRAKFLAKCILERAAFSAEKQDNTDGIALGVVDAGGCCIRYRIQLFFFSTFRYV